MKKKIENMEYNELKGYFIATGDQNALSSILAKKMHIFNLIITSKLLSSINRLRSNYRLNSLILNDSLTDNAIDLVNKKYNEYADLSNGIYHFDNIQTDNIITYEHVTDHKIEALDKSPTETLTRLDNMFNADAVEYAVAAVTTHLHDTSEYYERLINPQYTKIGLHFYGVNDIIVIFVGLLQ